MKMGEGEMDIRINSNTVGVALLVSNDYKTTTSAKYVPFTDTDTDDLEQIFLEFTYAVYRKKNVSNEEFKSYYEKVAKFKYPPSCKRILIYFSGHGCNGQIKMQDGSYESIENLINCFKVDSTCNDTLGNVVKMFFFDACRGELEDDQSGIKGNQSDNVDLTFPKERKTIVAYATAPYYVACGGNAGSRWTRCLVKALRESEERDDVCCILTSANHIMNGLGKKLQTADFSSNLAEFVHFKQEALVM